MRIIFFGSDIFGLPSLETLKRSFELVAVVSSVDKPKGRGLKISPNPIKEWAILNNITIFQPEKFDDNFINIISSLSPDLIVLISYGKILPSLILNIPKIASINVHPSLLPKYRGPAPIEWALINGETKTGITIIKMDEKIDTGKIIIQKEIEILPSDDAFTLKNKLSQLAKDILIEGIETFIKYRKTYPQIGHVSYARKLKKKDGLIKWENSAEKIHNLVRGVIIWPTAYTYLSINSTKKLIKIYKTEIGNKEGKFAKAGEIIKIEKDYIEVACGNGTIKIKELQIEGKKRMTVSQFLCGYRNKIKIPFFLSPFYKLI
ncbi:MAG: methionyl-tRNA formyltransferase [Candidatus Omnitrophica bacterium]|nr:methionyl-tRNA formyltransferase [Candidatus Omnitrophota bacterium]